MVVSSHSSSHITSQCKSMPWKTKPSCSACKTNTSPMWRKDEFGIIMCNSCYLNHLSASSVKDETASIPSDSDSLQSGSNNGLRTAIVAAKQNDLLNITNTNFSKDFSNNNSNVRKSTRIKPYHKNKTQLKANPWKGKNRRYIFKKKAPIKSHPSVSTIITRDSVFHQGFYYQVGDIVSLVDESGDIYYAQIQGLLQDEYCEKSAVITWLLPTTASNPDAFEPSTYILGPAEELPRKLDYMEFECHAPANYYKSKLVKVPGLHMSEPDLGYIWTSIGPKCCKAPTIAEIFGEDTSANVSPS
ncbi:GATA zinc finger domain-containing protein 1-like [Watersipora subatra]|uniref:GATA zinc finger domain-containing protein 1-like n=1 Tax=Watersipora subatra TaxID=2589382 RepID=UPI00355BD067